MAFKIMEQGRKPNSIWQTFFCDTNDDVANLPTNCPAGSRAIVAQNGDLYLLDSLGNWNPMPRGGGGGGGGGSDVIANPVLDGTEERLNGLEVDGVKYANPKEIEYIDYQFLITEITYDQVKDTYDAGKLPIIRGPQNYLYPITKYKFAHLGIDGTIKIYTVSKSGDTTSWDSQTYNYMVALMLDGSTTIIDSSDIFAVLCGEKMPVLYDGVDNNLIIGCHTDGSKIAFDEIDLNAGQFIQYHYTIGDNDPWGKTEIPIGALSFLFVKPNNTSFEEIVQAISMARVPLIADLATGKAYYVSNITMNNGDPVAVKFSTINKGTKYTWTVDYQGTWTSSTEYDSGIYYVEPNSTQFMDIVNVLQNNVMPVINDMANGRAYYISGYTMVGGQPAAITFSTLDGAYTWTVDYQDNWTST